MTPTCELMSTRAERSTISPAQLLMAGSVSAASSSKPCELRFLLVAIGKSPRKLKEPPRVEGRRCFEEESMVLISPLLADSFIMFILFQVWRISY